MRGNTSWSYIVEKPFSHSPTMKRTDPISEAEAAFVKPEVRSPGSDSLCQAARGEAAARCFRLSCARLTPAPCVPRAAVGWHVLLAGVLAVLLIVPMTHSNAASITWSNVVNIASDADVVTNDYMECAYFYSSSGSTVNLNGVPFTGSGNSKNIGANITTTFPVGGGSVGGMGTSSGLSAEYQAVLGGCAYYDGSAAVTVTLNSLNTGGRYFVQIWINDSRSTGARRAATVTSPGGNTINFDYNLADAVGGRGQFAVGTFVVDATTQTFTIQSAVSAQLNAIQLRSIPVINLTVSVNATQPIRTVDRRIFGVNTALYDSALPGSVSIPLMSELGVQVSRWPGGSYGDTFLISTEASRRSWQARTTNFCTIVKTNRRGCVHHRQLRHGHPAG